MGRKAQALTVLGVGVALLWWANYVGAHWFDYPFLYCWCYPLAGPIYFQGAVVVLYICVLCGLYWIWRGDSQKIIAIGVIVFAVIELPNVADYLLRLGGSCA